MRPHPRIRKTVKWGGAVVCVLLLVLWVVSGWYWITLCTSGEHTFYVSSGQFTYLEFLGNRAGLGGPNIMRQYSAINDQALPFGMRWGFNKSQGAGITFLEAPLWIFFVAFAGMTAAAWRLDTLARRRATLGACPKCSYSRDGLRASAPCPECGAPAPVRA